MDPSGAETIVIETRARHRHAEWARLGFYGMPVEVREPTMDVVAAVQAVARERGHARVDWWVTPSTRPGSLDVFMSCADTSHLRRANRHLGASRSAGKQPQRLIENVLTDHVRHKHVRTFVESKLTSG